MVSVAEFLYFMGIKPALGERVSNGRLAIPLLNNASLTDVTARIKGLFRTQNAHCCLELLDKAVLVKADLMNWKMTTISKHISEESSLMEKAG